jgi:hypothetical protein
MPRRNIPFKLVVAAITVVLNILLIVTVCRFNRRSLPADQRRVIGYACHRSCGGWADRQKGIVATYIIAAILRQE